MLADVLALKPWITFLKPPTAEKITNVIVSTFCDASFQQACFSGYGQTGILIGLRISREDGLDIYHPHWCSTKQRRVCYSPYGAGISACADGDDRGFYYKCGLNALFPETKIKSELFSDSRCL